MNETGTHLSKSLVSSGAPQLGHRCVVETRSGETRIAKD